MLEAANVKISNLEKGKMRMAQEMDDLAVEVERVSIVHPTPAIPNTNPNANLVLTLIQPGEGQDENGSGNGRPRCGGWKGQYIF